MLEDYLKFVSETVAAHGYAIIFAGLVLENTVGLGLVFPGLVILIFGGFTAAVGPLNIFLVLLSGYLGTLLGDNLSYCLGYYGLVKIPAIRRISDDLNRIEAAISKSTSRFLLVFHFPVFSRMVLPVLLGTLKFRFSRWLVFDSIGAAFFVTTFVMVGYVVGITSRALKVAISTSTYIQWVFFILFAWWLISVVLTVRRLLHRKAHKPQREPDRPDDKFH